MIRGRSTDFNFFDFDGSQPLLLLVDVGSMSQTPSHFTVSGKLIVKSLKNISIYMLMNYWIVKTRIHKKGSI